MLSLLTINVSEFFRDPAQFGLIQDAVLPDLAKRHASPRIWSAGCAHGEEPYTLAIMADQLGAQVDILATDIDAEAITRARAGGPYTPVQVRKVPLSVQMRYFEETLDGYMISNRIRRRVRFLIHDLVTGPIRHQFDLIVCRNVTIYFTAPVKAHLIRSFFDSLRPGGYLFIGGAESLLGAEAEGFSRFAGNVYQKDARLKASSDSVKSRRHAAVIGR